VLVVVGIAVGAAALVSRIRDDPTAAIETVSSTTTTAPSSPSSTRSLRYVTTVSGEIAPKSVVASGTGVVIAQNMMYEHTVTVYDRDGTLVETIPDSVNLAEFGITGHPGVAQGAPVEAAFTPDGRYAYVSNYSMYGEGFGPEGSDDCTPAQGVDASFVYRIDAEALVIDQVIPVGSVPKYVAVTPDGRSVLVTNWCSYDLSVIDAASTEEAARLALGAWPRGVAVDPESKTAYIAVMGGQDVAVVDLDTFDVQWIYGVGGAPRHVVMDPAGQFLYVTLNADGQVAKIDLATRQVVAEVSTGNEPRSMAIAPDGQSLYVVNYGSSTVSKVRTDTMTEIQTVTTNSNPIGITYEPTSNRVWVACYSGTIEVFDDA
jgi:YVTN family beta-propeller protein